MRFTEEQLDDLRRRVPVVDIAKDYVKLKKAGRKLVGPCPICSKGNTKGDKRFAVKESGENWGCAACGDGGDVIALVMRITGKPFLDAIEWLGGTRELSAEERERLKKN